ncbi:hypothetical protein FG051_01195 [Companilactobacillus futsaii]|uniref:Uncharacterized protein n=2 Tax=Companilactobacillus futsaii TaxID=938155 RepID=A0A5B7SZP9_9LACO|nr:hypothetical protein FG051_01195 [Companilactobacillus futsaii]
MLLEKAKLSVTKYLKNHWLVFVVKVCLAIYAVQKMFSLEAKDPFSIEGCLLIIFLVIAALIIDSIYYSYQDE